jgi:hypothetical protein
VLTFEIRAADQPREIEIAHLVLAQQHQRRGLRTLTQLAHPQIDTDDRLHAARLRRAIELHHREQVALIRERHRRHPGDRHRIHQPRRTLPLARDPHDAVDQRVFGVEVKVDEGH